MTHCNELLYYIQAFIIDCFINIDVDTNIFVSDSCDKIPHGAYLGSELELDTYEAHFNEDLMATKHQELAQAFYSSDFPPAKTFYQGKNNHLHCKFSPHKKYGESPCHKDFP